MKLFTKSIYDKKEDIDGLRILISRWYPRNIKNTYISFWDRQLSPSISLLNDYRHKNITWEDYTNKFIEEMNKSEPILSINKIITRLKNGETITLLCFEKGDESIIKCHRRLVKEIIIKEYQNIGD